MARALKDWLDGYMKYTQRSEPPDTFRLWSGLSTIASCLQRKCRLNWGTLTFFPNMYVVLIGPSGVRKGTAMAPGYDILEDIGIPIASEAITREALIRELSERTDTDYGDDGERILHTSLTVYSEELTVFLGYNNLQLIADLCDWYDCKRRWKYRTKGSGTDDIVNLWVNLFGATTPTTLMSALPSDAIGAGLTSRIIFVYEEEKGKWVADPFQTEEDKFLRTELVSDLEAIYMLRGPFKVTEKFIDFWIPWYNNLKNIPKPNDYRLHGYWSRRPAHLLKMSMLLNASRTDDMLIDVEDFNRAFYLLEYTERNMHRTFAGMGSNEMGANLQRVMGMVGNEGEILLSNLMRSFHFDLDSISMKNILTTLEIEGFIKTPEKVESKYGSDYLIKYSGRYGKDGGERSEDSLGLFSPTGGLITGSDISGNAKGNLSQDKEDS